jgi:hypothetical protein
MILSELGIISANKKDEKSASEVFSKILPDKDFFLIEYDKPSQYVSELWNRYEKIKQDNQNNINGKIFEYIIASLCIRESISPLFYEAKIAFVPNVNYDIIMYTGEFGPVCLSLKTSLRERYKQADLEAIALKYVHRKAKCFLITLEEKEANTVKKKISDGSVIGLDDVIVATTQDIDNLYLEFRNYKFKNPGTISIVNSSLFTDTNKINAAKSRYS